MHNSVIQHSRFQLTYLISFILGTGSLILAMRGRDRSGTCGRTG
jgi:hypothetical protein